MDLLTLSESSFPRKTWKKKVNSFEINHLEEWVGGLSKQICSLLSAVTALVFLLIRLSLLSFPSLFYLFFFTRPSYPLLLPYCPSPFHQREDGWVQACARKSSLIFILGKSKKKWVHLLFLCGTFLRFFEPLKTGTTGVGWCQVAGTSSSERFTTVLSISPMLTQPLTS
jgi:hypothetical protein